MLGLGLRPQNVSLGLGVGRCGLVKITDHDNDDAMRRMMHRR